MYDSVILTVARLNHATSHEAESIITFPTVQYIRLLFTMKKLCHASIHFENVPSFFIQDFQISFELRIGNVSKIYAKVPYALDKTDLLNRPTS